jgi:DNA recombination protein RmuC
MLIYIAFITSIIFIPATAFLIFINAQLKKQLSVQMQDKNQMAKKLENMQGEQEGFIIKKTEAETMLAAAREHLAKLENERNILKKDRELALDEKNQYMRESELVKQRILTIQNEMENWKKTKEQHIDIAKASIMEAGSQLSNKLLDDHKREIEAAKKENEKIVKDTTDELHKKFQNVFENMSTLSDKVNKSTDTVELVRRSLLSPSGAGSLAEITLANIFKASNLIENQDYHMQYSVAASEEKGALRPDAVVFLPGNNVMVIDSKASKFFVEMEENSLEQNALGESLKKSMNKHLSDLVSRDYQQAVEKQLGDVNATTLMFLPTETALEKLRQIDPNFMDKAWKARILPVGPTGLVNALLQAKILISNAKQEENSKLILNEVRDLLGSVVKLYELAGSLGKGLNGVFKKYDEFAGSFNRTFMSKAKKINDLGANVQKLNELKKLERFSLDTRDYKQIEAEVEEETEVETV